MVLLGFGQIQSNREQAAPEPQATAPDRYLRAFTPHSWWNTPLPRKTPLHPHAKEILAYLRTGPETGNGCLMLAGVQDSPWGTPIYWARTTDPVYRVRQTHHHLPPELRSLRIPADARPASNNDGTMTVYDVDKGYVVALTDAVYDAADDTWSATGATVSYLDSNGLDAGTGLSDDPRNKGTHRGNNAPTMVVSWDQVQQGDLGHVLKIASGPPLADRHIFPMTGSDGQDPAADPAIPPQGLRMRIRPSVDLDAMDLDPQALVIARAIQEYGVYIGDSGGRTALKVENTSAEGRGRLWNLSRDALCGLPFDRRWWDVVAEDFDPSGTTGRTAPTSVTAAP